MTDLPARVDPLLIETPQESLGPLVRERFLLGEQTFLLDRPADYDHLLDHPMVRSAFAADEYMPYWADLWPAARMLAKALVKEPWTIGAGDDRLHALEIGCGLGLPGIVALSLGMRVTFTDYDATALHFAANNARLNGFTDFDLLQMDWRFPPERQFKLILAADLIYELRNIEPLVLLIERMLNPDGECWLTDQDRVPAHALRSFLAERRLPYTTTVLKAGDPTGRRMKGTLYRIRLASGAAEARR